MIQKMIRQMLTAQIFSALAVSVCLLIDNIMIGRFLGEEALAAYGLANPLLLAIGAIASMLAVGVQAACSSSLGRGSQEETDAGYSSALTISGCVSLVCVMGVFLFSPALARLLGAGSEGTLYTETEGYLRGFTLGAPACLGALVLIPFLQLAGQNRLLIAAVLTMAVLDIGMDLLNALVFHGGMYGMGLASSLSYYGAVAVTGFYFLSRRCAFRFSFRRVSLRKIRELFRSGVPALFGMAAQVILIFTLNQILKGIGGSGAVEAFSVISSIGNSAGAINTGVGGVSLTLGGIFFHEEDRTSLRETIRTLVRYAALLGAGMCVLLLAAAPALTALFLSPDSPVFATAVLGLRIFSTGLAACCVNNALKSMYQATGRMALAGGFAVVEGAVLPILAAFVLSCFLGTTGVWLYYLVGETAALILMGVWVRKATGRLPWQEDAVLMLKKDFGAAPEDQMELRISSLKEVAEAAETAEGFCLSHGQSGRLSSHIGLCVEEMAGNIIQHGFSADGGKHHLYLRLVRKPDLWVLRFRDDCGAFNPLQYVPRDREDGLGIRLAMKMAREASYTHSLNLNNLTLKLAAENAEEMK